MSGAPTEAVEETLKMASVDSRAVLELDVRFFAKGAQASTAQRVEAVLALINKFVEEPSPDEPVDDDEVPESMKRNTKKPETSTQ